MTPPFPHLAPLWLGLAAAVVADLGAGRIPNAISAFLFCRHRGTHG